MRVLAFLLIWLPCLGMAQSDTAADARAAMDSIAAASEQLEAASSARDRVRALTETIGAFEQGLAALRSGIRRASLQETEIAAQLLQRDTEIGVLLAALQHMGRGGAPIALLHPEGATGTARAGMMLAEMVPALNESARDVRTDLAALQELRAVQSAAANQLGDGLTDVQAARAALNTAIAERTDLPTRFTNDPIREAILIASADTLERFAEGLDLLAIDVTGAPPAQLSDRKGSLALPVAGQIKHRAGQTDAAGVTRPGLIVATPARALVTTPVAATIRYTGPLLDLGQVVILEPQANVLFVLAGLETLYGRPGEVIDAGAPVGLMGGQETQSGAESSTDSDVTGAALSETLYIEVRQDNTPEDPSLWFRTDKDG